MEPAERESHGGKAGMKKANKTTTTKGKSQTETGWSLLLKGKSIYSGDVWGNGGVTEKRASGNVSPKNKANKQKAYEIEHEGKLQSLQVDLRNKLISI